MMTSSRGSRQTKMSWATGKSPGWTAFHQSHLQNQDVGSKLQVELYPPLPNSSSTLLSHSGNGNLKNLNADKNGLFSHHISNFPATSSFSSIVKSSIIPLQSTDGTGDFATSSLSDNEGVSSNMQGTSNHEDKSRSPIIERMSRIHTWADTTLIEDILAATGNDEDHTDLLLSSMTPDIEAVETAKQVDDLDASLCGNDFKEGCQPSGDLYKKLTPPVEPELEEENDVYLCHRKDALRMMRLASHHSRASGSAFSRGDHLHARQLSLRAKGEWMEAEKLNLKAAEKILRIRNDGNDVWKLDLHGLHACEAVHALEIHLNKIECLMMTKYSTTSAQISKGEGETERCLPSACINPLPVEENPANKKLQVSASRPRRQSVLEVITGVGAHSRGDASLPAAVRSFLLANGYHFHDGRPGVIDVRPKFRHR